MATLVTQSLVALAHIYATKKILPYKINFKQVGLFLVFIAGMIGVFIGAREATDDWWVNLLIGSAASMLLALALKVVDIAKLTNLIRANN